MALVDHSASEGASTNPAVQFAPWGAQTQPCTESKAICRKIE
jgi:hypothetical protein